jgi:simple sugar transport system substrate-binding protein
MGRCRHRPSEREVPQNEARGDKIETNDDQQTAYAKTRELLKAYPNLKGLQGSSAVDVAGAGLAIEEMGIQDKIAVVGTSLVSVSGQYLKTGAVDMISFWDPADAGYAMNQVALTLLEGKEITDGMDLGVPATRRSCSRARSSTARPGWT